MDFCFSGKKTLSLADAETDLKGKKSGSSDISSDSY